MRKSFVRPDHVVVMDLTAPTRKKAIHESEASFFKVLFKGSRLEASLFAKASSKEQEGFVTEWQELRQRRRLPLNSDNLQEMDSRIDELQKKFGPMFETEKSKIVADKKRDLSSAISY